MSTEEDRSASPSSYLFDAENAAEMARLIKQAKTLNRAFGLLPSSLELADRWHLLDIGCGAGEWALEVAQHYPFCQVFGIDLSPTMIQYASYLAQNRNLPNVQFEGMDARQSLDFPEKFFDVINGRFMVSFMSKEIWPVLLGECLRVLRKGGTFVGTEPESLGTTTSPSLAQYNLLMTQAMRQAGQCFTPSGEQYGLAGVLPRLLRETGFEEIQQEAFVIDYSAGMPAHQATYENLQTMMKLLQPLLVRCGLITQEEVDILYARTLREMASETFCAAVFFQRVWGKKSA